MREKKKHPNPRKHIKQQWFQTVWLQTHHKQNSSARRILNNEPNTNPTLTRPDLISLLPRTLDMASCCLEVVLGRIAAQTQSPRLTALFHHPRLMRSRGLPRSCSSKVLLQTTLSSVHSSTRRERYGRYRL